MRRRKLLQMTASGIVSSGLSSISALAQSSSPGLAADAAEHLKPVFSGELIMPDDASYDEARTLWNARFDKSPSMIARCSSAEDVVKVVNFASERGLGATVRSGRHDLAGRCLMDDEISIDLTQMGKISVDPVKRSVRAEAGATWRNVTAEVQKHGLATGGPMDSNVTVSGYGLGGGLNLMMRKHGLACDNILSIEMVTSDGDQITVDKNQHADLFWAMRGAGANFGVVTALEYQLHPIPTVLAGSVTWALGDDPVTDARGLLHHLRDYGLTAPDEVTTFTYLLNLPDVGPVISIWVCYTGDLEIGANVIEPLRSYGQPISDDVREVSYTEQQTRVDFVAPDGRHYYYRTQLLNRLDDSTLEALITQYVKHTVPELFIILEHFGGAIARVPEEETAFAGRDADYCLLFGGGTDTAVGMETLGPVIRELGEALVPHASGRAYINYLDSDQVGAVPNAYGAERYAKLQDIKQRYDAQNMFRFSQSIA